MIIFKSVSVIDKLLFTKHLSIMIKSGVPIYEALDTLASNTKSEYFKIVLRAVIKEVENGKTLYESMRKFPNVFDNFYTSLIKVSEESGTLESTLKYLSEQLSKDYALRKKIQGAMFYPTLVLCAGLGIGGFISVFVLPKLTDFFENIDIPLPLTTRILIGFSNLMKHYGILIFGGIFAFMIFFRWLITTPFFKPIWQGFLLRVPILGKLLIYSQVTRFTRNLGTLMQSGVPLANGLETSANTLNILSFKHHLHKVKDDLTKGRNISDSLERNNFKEFPNMTVKMIKVGEKTGNLEDVLMYLSSFYEDEIDDITKNLTNILEPLMLAGIGLAVAFLALAIIGPIYEITGNINH